ncbi:hypothetical protein NA57DRAFT_56971 [Rhizodiscina lignyota]|uniref:Uncharacterized protein n=1 Tax=Rhizodiscina lignyota TaxID=1504668 RepID=A0A9P4ID32_9PEZI|nr:hypothetical protein NA57DRAFT_56971 [Rhizodiscina lignyota]
MRASFALLALTAVAVSAQSLDNSFMTAVPGCNEGLDKYDACVSSAVDAVDYEKDGALCTAYSGIATCLSSFCGTAATLPDSLTKTCPGGGSSPTSGSGSGSNNAATTGAGSGGSGSGAQETGTAQQQQGNTASRNVGAMGVVIGGIAFAVGSLAVML